MTPSPILKVLSSMRKNGVNCLLMGGQACVLYGAAEFSRDTDLAILADAENLGRLQNALDELQAECIAVPPFEAAYLEMGLAVHFRCQHAEARNMRVDVMSRMRGVENFPALWSRRTTFAGGETIDALALPDLVQAKKTQRDKDWPMIARLVEANFFANVDHPTPQQIDFWLRQLRTPSLLISVAQRFTAECDQTILDRSLLTLAKANDVGRLAQALYEEEQQEREADRRYWLPLKHELSRLRRLKRSK